jgi:WhiB family transcriptional regulator, redox-sensing transcriptional regulator
MPTPTVSTVAALPPHFGDPRAACRRENPEMFYPDRFDDEQADAAKAVCRRCPLISTCLAYALRYEPDHGVWAATTPAERRAIAKGKRLVDGRTIGDQQRLREAFTAARRVVDGNLSRRDAITGVGRQTFDVATAVVRYAPHLVDDVVEGWLTLRAAGLQAQAAKNEQRSAA